MKSDAHQQAVSQAAEKGIAHVTGGLPQAFQEQRMGRRNALVCAIKCLYCLVTQEMPHTTNYVGYLRFVKHVLCQQLQLLSVGRNATYTSMQTSADFLMVIPECIEEDILSKLKGSESFALMADESTSIAVTKELIMFARAVAEREEQKTFFLKIVALQDGKSPTIVEAIESWLTQKLLSVNNVSSFGSDGAAAMIAGVLQRQNPNLLSVHCICHQLALAASQAAAEITYVKKLKDILSSLFYFYNNSAVHSSGLKEVQSLLNSNTLTSVFF